MKKLKNISDTIADFARPIIDQVNDTVTAEDLKSALNVAVAVWDAMILEESGEGGGFLDRVRETILNSDYPSFIEYVDHLVERKREHFAGDMRAVIKFDVARGPDGTFRIVAETS